MKTMLSGIFAMALIGLTAPVLAAGDLLTQARMAAVEGNHEKCASLADAARREPTAVWRAHHVYATCQIYVTEARKPDIAAAEYASELRKAIDALQFLLDTPGILVIQEQRASVELMVDELFKRISPTQ